MKRKLEIEKKKFEKNAHRAFIILPVQKYEENQNEFNSRHIFAMRSIVTKSRAKYLNFS